MWIDKNGTPVGSFIVHANMVIHNPTDDQLIAAGCTWKDDVSGDVVIDTTAFEAACAKFRQICGEIGTLIGVENFLGGFDQMEILYAHDAYRTLPGLCLALAWKGLDGECRYLGAKIGLGQPEWWYRCWELVGITPPR